MLDELLEDIDLGEGISSEDLISQVIPEDEISRKINIESEEGQKELELIVTKFKDISEESYTVTEVTDEGETQDGEGDVVEDVADGVADALEDAGFDTEGGEDGIEEVITDSVEGDEEQSTAIEEVANGLADALEDDAELDA